MKNNVLQLLQRCYEGSRNPVLLLDEDWNVVWSVHNPGVKYLPAMMGISEDCWESSTRALCIGDTRFECSLLCNEQDGVRIAMLREPDSTTIPVETEIISSAISSVNAACTELHRKRQDDARFIRAITGNCYKIYRTTYLQKTLERRNAGFWEKTCFSAKASLIELETHIEGILGDTTNVNFDLCNESAYLEADKDAFITAMLAAIVLCYDEDKKDKRHELDICLSLDGSKLIFTVSMEPTPEDRYDQQDRLSHFGSLMGEKMLMDTFCKEYNGRWMQHRTGNVTSCRLELPAAAPSRILTLNSPQERTEGRFFNKYEILLARIHFRGFY